MSLNRTRPPCPTAISRSANSAAEPTVAKVRKGCSLPPKSVRPPALSLCTWRNWRDTSAAEIRKACMRTGSSAMSTCRCTPPTRLTAPTPLMESNRLTTVWSTNQLKPSSSKFGEVMVNANTGPPVKSSFLTTGSSKSFGKSLRAKLTAERISSKASCMGFSILNSQVINTEPSCTLV